jgi:hypothetical protein
MKFRPMAELTLSTFERDGVRYELVVSQVDLADFQHVGQFTVPVHVRVTPVEDVDRG